MRTVLLVEPDVSTARVCKSRLQEDKFKVIISRTASDALALLNHENINVIVFEPQLGGHGGVEFLYEARSYADLQNIPIILHTSLPKEVIESYNASLNLLNVHSYLYKVTTNLNDLVAKVKSAVNT